MNIENIKSWIYSHKKTSIFIGLILFGQISLLINPPKVPEKKVESISDVKVEQKIVFDLPQLFDKNISEIVKILGNPSKNDEVTQVQIKAGVDTWEKFFEKDGFKLMVTYDTKSRIATDFFISREGEITEVDKSTLAKVGNISFEDKSYSSKMIPWVGHPDKFTGLLVKTKKPSIAKWDELLNLTKQANIVYKDVKKAGDTDIYNIYVDRGWYSLKVDMKKDILAKFSQLKKEITGYGHIKFKDSNTDELVAEVGSFGGLEIYK